MGRHCTLRRFRPQKCSNAKQEKQTCVGRTSEARPAASRRSLLLLQMATFSSPVEGTSMSATSRVPFPFRRNLLDKWSSDFHTFGKMGAKGRDGVYKRPGSSPSATTLFLGSGRPFDKAEAARLAAAERRGERSPDHPHISVGRNKRAVPSVVNLTPGGF
jgi:hypothetical protein